MRRTLSDGWRQTHAADLTGLDWLKGLDGIVERIRLAEPDSALLFFLGIAIIFVRTTPVFRQLK